VRARACTSVSSGWSVLLFYQLSSAQEGIDCDRHTYLFEMDVLTPQNMSCIACPYVANNFRVKDGEQSLLNFRGILDAMLS